MINSYYKYKKNIEIVIILVFFFIALFDIQSEVKLLLDYFTFTSLYFAFISHPFSFLVIVFTPYILKRI